MRILYDSKLECFKSPFGTLREGQSCTLNINIPSDCKTSSVRVVFEREDGKKTEFGFYLHSQSDGYDIYRCVFSLEERGLYFYKFNITTQNERFDLYRYGESDTNIEEGSLWQLSVIPKSFRVSTDFDGAVMYQIFPDRFAKKGECSLQGKLEPYWVHDDMHDTPEFRPNEKGEVLNCDFFGGNLRGIISKLDHLKSLSVGVIYLNPIFKAYSNHRYDTADYKTIDPMLGNEQDFAELCEKAHEKGIKIILDGVFSHTGSNSIYFDAKGVFGNGALSNQSSPYCCWFDFQSYPDVYTSWWGIKTLPCTRETEPSYMDYIIYDEDSVVAHWLKLGADGYRLDVADELPDAFISALEKRVHEIDPEALVLGEVWEDASNKESYGMRRRYFVDGELQSVMNYPWRNAIIDFARGEDDGGMLAGTVITIAENYPPEVVGAIMNILSTHDTPRILTELGDRFIGDKAEKENRTLNGEALSLARKRLKLASFLQYTLPGMPCVYYGDEVGMQGFEDPLNRRFFPWDNTDGELLEHYVTLGELKSSLPELRGNRIEFLKSGCGVIHFVRAGAEYDMHIIASNSPCEIELPLSGELLYSQNTSMSEDKIKLSQYGFVLIKA